MLTTLLFVRSGLLFSIMESSISIPTVVYKILVIVIKAALPSILAIWGGEIQKVEIFGPVRSNTSAIGQ